MVEDETNVESQQLGKCFVMRGKGKKQKKVELGIWNNYENGYDIVMIVDIKGE